jgi:hypothetical protein
VRKLSRRSVIEGDDLGLSEAGLAKSELLLIPDLGRMVWEPRVQRHSCILDIATFLYNERAICSKKEVELAYAAQPESVSKTSLYPGASEGTAHLFIGSCHYISLVGYGKHRRSGMGQYLKGRIMSLWDFWAP